MNCISTRNGSHRVTFQQALFQGLSSDGGLYLPELTPDLRDLFLGFDERTSFGEIAARVTHGLLSDELNLDQCIALCKKAFTFSPELLHLSSKHRILELFHGPSCAFKDFGASFLANVMEAYLEQENRRAIILTATSGDTGSAVAQAFHGKKSIDVVILYPSGRVSPSQEKQLTTLGGNVHALEVRGSFDDCQRIVKEAFLDKKLNSKFPLTSANSINLGRLLPQSFYYIWAWAQLRAEGKELSFCVPSGNFGNLTAGILAKNWGLPVDSFIVATNENDVVPQYLLTGKYESRASVATLANAMDVGSPSNFERLQVMFHSSQSMGRVIRGMKQSDGEILNTMERIHREYGVFLCPHTAAGVGVGEIFLRDETNRTMVTLGTAHPGKFSEVVHRATGLNPPIPQTLVECLHRTKIATPMDPTLEDLSVYLQRELA